MTEHEPILQIKNVSNTMKLLTTAVLIAILLSGRMAVPVLADASAKGVVIEGESVPGLTLGDTRTQVVAAYGDPYMVRTSKSVGILPGVVTRRKVVAM
ncbi:MAG: hypothetical protein WBL25_01755 [Anaerolineales bacterium]